MRFPAISEALVRVAVHAAADEPDADRLGRFVRDRDAVAFEVLVRRHGSLVIGIHYAVA